MYRTVMVSVSTLAFLAALAVPASAQPPESGLKIAANVGASLGDGNTSAAVGGAIGYRFNRHVGIEFEVSYTPSLEFEGMGLSIPYGMAGVQPGHVTSMPWLPNGPGFGAYDDDRYPTMQEQTPGSMLTFLANFVGELPTGASWVSPYVLAGMGSATVTEEYGVGWGEGPPGSAGHVENSRTALAITAGGGVDFTIWKGLAVGIDARYIHVALEGGALNTVRAGTRVSYRF